MCHGSQFLDTIQETSKNVVVIAAAAAVAAAGAVVVVGDIDVVDGAGPGAIDVAAAADINELRTVARYQLFDE